MAKVELVFVPPGGGEIDYAREVELPGVPSSGDYITLFESSESGSRDFIVRRAHWIVLQDGMTTVAVEAEFAVSGRSSEEHVRAAEGHARKKGCQLPRLEATAY